MKIYKRTLANGLRVLLAPKLSLESTSIVIGVGFGSLDVGSNHRGLAHYLEHMLFKGTKKRSWSDINKITRKYSIYLNAETDYETTMFEVGAYKRYISNAMELVSDIIKMPKFDSEEFRHELGPIIHEIAIRKEDPDSIVYDNMPRALFRDSGNTMPENESSVEENISIKGIINAYDKYYNPRNCVAVIYGGTDLQSGMDLARRYFLDFKHRFSKPSRNPLVANTQTRNITIKRTGIGRGEIAMGFGCHGIDRSHIREFVAMNVVAGILNNRLYDQVREIHGLSYDPSVEYDAYGTFSCLFASAGGPPAKLGRIKTIIMGEFGRLKEGYISKEELKTVKRGLEIKYSMDSDDATGTAARIAGMELMYGDGKIYESIPKLVRKLDMTTARKFVDRYIDMKRYGLVTLSSA